MQLSQFVVFVVSTLVAVAPCRAENRAKEIPSIPCDATIASPPAEATPEPGSTLDGLLTALPIFEPERVRLGRFSKVVYQADVIGTINNKYGVWSLTTPGTALLMIRSDGHVQMLATRRSGDEARAIDVVEEVNQHHSITSRNGLALMAIKSDICKVTAIKAESELLSLTLLLDFLDAYLRE